MNPLLLAWLQERPDGPFLRWVKRRLFQNFYRCLVVDSAVSLMWFRTTFFLIMGQPVIVFSLHFPLLIFVFAFQLIDRFFFCFFFFHEDSPSCHRCAEEFHDKLRLRGPLAQHELPSQRDEGVQYSGLTRFLDALQDRNHGVLSSLGLSNEHSRPNAVAWDPAQQSFVCVPIFFEPTPTRGWLTESDDVSCFTALSLRSPFLLTYLRVLLPTGAEADSQHRAGTRELSICGTFGEFSGQR
mmetsp:Transcript_31099/g.75845  ORF Transcript_31099/g.75845 Transcript_31099/m.75845 type:complete len:240 (+) Transcript_31099:1873-2592(+)